MLHVFNETTGAHVESANQGSDLSRWGQGYRILSADLEDPDAWKLEEGELARLSDSELLAAAKLSRVKELSGVVNYFIAAKPDGRDRYNTNLKLNLIQATLQAMAAGQSPPEAVTAVNNWMTALKGRYSALKSEIKSTNSKADLEAIDLSYAALEAAYGVAGTVLADPDVYTSDLSQGEA